MTVTLDRPAGTCRVDGVTYHVFPGPRASHTALVRRRDGMYPVGAFFGDDRVCPTHDGRTRQGRDESRVLRAIQRAWLTDDAARARGE